MAHRLKFEDRLKIQKLLEQRTAVDVIANELGYSATAIYSEIQRGSVAGTYNAKFSQEQANRKRTTPKKQSIFVKHRDMAEEVANLLQKKIPVYKIIDILKNDIRFKDITPNAPVTIYQAIERGEIPNITTSTLEDFYIVTLQKTGNIHIPETYQNRLGLNLGDNIVITCDNDKIIIKKK